MDDKCSWLATYLYLRLCVDGIDPVVVPARPMGW